MKKILAFIICIVLMCAMPLAVFAEGEIVWGEPTETLPVEETIPETEEVIPEPTPETIPTPTPETTPNDEPTPPPEVTPEGAYKTATEWVAKWLEENYAWLSVVLAIIGNVIYLACKVIAPLKKGMSVLNNNSITVAENGNAVAKKATETLEKATEVINGYEDKMASLLEKIDKNEEEKKQLQQALTDTHKFLKTTKLAEVELSNEIAELLVLANIPNSKKEELYSRHLAAVNAIADADKTEVKEDDEKAE